VVLTAVDKVSAEEQETIERFGAQLLYKWQGYREIVEALDEMIGLLLRRAAA
jgi:hypothetical protein